MLVGVLLGVLVGVDVGDSVGVCVGVLVAVPPGVWVGALAERASKAPIEQLLAPTPGRVKPRWSRLFTGSVEHTLWSPALIAGLAAVQPVGAPAAVHSASVCVGPPLFTKPAGSSWGLVLQNELPVVVVQPVPVKPHVVPSSMLWPPSVTAPVQLPPELLLARMVLVTISEP